MMFQETQKQFAPGMRIEVRDAEWLVRRVDSTSTGGYHLSCIGISELVKDKEAIFLSDLESSIEVLKPEETQLVPDTSSAFQASRLYMESLLRQKAPTDENLYVGHNAAMDFVPYQMDPALQALELPRQRILIADAVGLGKTLEAGILVSELIKRGKGKRILAVTVKSMLTQFQKEFWCRFTIPLTRLDSVGIQRIRNRIPTNHNPFYFYDKSIISIDTLKQDAEYRTYIENAYWDIIIIDEAHNVADRGTGALRNKLAQLLAHRSDTLIMLSATPHDGKAKSFASLMNMLNPTAIANPEKYTKDDITGLFIRRFKKDILDQVRHAFQERSIKLVTSDALPEEETVFDMFSQLQFAAIDQHRSRSSGAGKLFKTTLEKALFSSPAACIETVDNRIHRLEKERPADDDAAQNDIRLLSALKEKLLLITPDRFSKYQKLLEVIQDKTGGFGWNGKDKRDRLVIFTERLETMRFLEKHLTAHLKLKPKQVLTLTGEMSDTEQQKAVEDFGKEESPVRLLIATDVASEGINLHFLCHRMVHFDIPWSLMVFQQRNGRIDRYGQENIPEIVYLMEKSQNEKINGDSRILEVLVRKDKQAVENIGDPAVFMKSYDIDEEELITAEAIEAGQSAESFEQILSPDTGEDNDPFSMFALTDDTAGEPTGQTVTERTTHNVSLYADDFDYLSEGLRFYRQSRQLQAEIDKENREVTVTLNDDLRQRFRHLPPEVLPSADSGNVWRLSPDKDTIKNEMVKARKEELAWPKIHYLWELNPMLEWLRDKVTAAFGRLQAPVQMLPGALQKNETIFLLSGMIPNRKSHPLLHYWRGVSFIDGSFNTIESFESVLVRSGLGKRNFPNPGNYDVPGQLKELLPQAVEKMRDWMRQKRKDFENDINDKLNHQLKKLERLKQNQFEQLSLDFPDTGPTASLAKDRRDKKRREIETIFNDYLDFVQETLTTEKTPYIQIISVLIGEE